MFWHALTNKYPEWLYFDSKVVDYPELNRVNALGTFFVTIRRRGHCPATCQHPFIKLDQGRY